MTSAFSNALEYFDCKSLKSTIPGTLLINMCGQTQGPTSPIALATPLWSEAQYVGLCNNNSIMPETFHNSLAVMPAAIESHRVTVHFIQGPWTLERSNIVSHTQKMHLRNVYLWACAQSNKWRPTQS